MRVMALMALLAGFLIVVSSVSFAHSGTASLDRIATAAASGHGHPMAREDLCSSWAIQMHAVPDDWRLHAMGCHAPYGVWLRDGHRCMRIAYSVSRHAYDAAAIARHGCKQFEDGTWSTI